MPYMPAPYKHPDYWNMFKKEGKQRGDMMASLNLHNLAEEKHPVTEAERIPGAYQLSGRHYYQAVCAVELFHGKLYSFLYQNFGNHVISGVMTNGVFLNDGKYTTFPDVFANFSAAALPRSFIRSATVWR